MYGEDTPRRPSGRRRFYGRLVGPFGRPANGYEQVNKAIADVDNVVQQAATNSEQSSGAAQGLFAQAEDLTELVGKFSLK